MPCSRNILNYNTIQCALKFVQFETVISMCRNPSHVDDQITSSTNSTPAEAVLPESVYQQAVNLLQLAKTSCSRSPESLALFMEELAVIIREGNVHSKVEVS